MKQEEKTRSRAAKESLIPVPNLVTIQCNSGLRSFKQNKNAKQLLCKLACQSRWCQNIWPRNKKIKTLRTTSVYRIYKNIHVVNFMPATDEAAMPSISAWKQNPIHLHCTGVEANKPIAIWMASFLPLLSCISLWKMFTFWVCAPLQKFISTQNQHLGFVRAVKSAIVRFDDILKGNKKNEAVITRVCGYVKSYNGLLAMSVWLVDSLWTPYEVRKKERKCIQHKWND